MDKPNHLFSKIKPFSIWGMGDLYFIISVSVALLFGILSPNIAKQLHLSSTQLGFLGGVFFLCYGFAQLLAGRLIDFLGPRYTMTGSAIIASSGLILLATANGFGFAVGAQILIGAGLSTAYVGTIYLANMWFPADRFCLMAGITEMSSNIIVAVIIFIMVLAGALVNFRIIIGSFSIIALIIAVLMFLIIRSRSDRKSITEHKVSFITALSKLIKIPQFRLSVIYFSTGFGALLALADLWNVPTQIAYRHTLQTAASLNAMFPLGGAIGALCSGWIADHLKCRAIVAKFYITGMLVLTIILVYGPVFPTAVTFILLLLLGFCFGGAVLGFPLVEQNITDDLQGTGFGFMTMIAYLLSACLQFLIGDILGHTKHLTQFTTISHFKIALTPLVIILAIGWICSLWLKDPKNKET